MKKLEHMEYVLVHRGGRGQSFVYELIYNGEGKEGGTFLMGLADVNELKNTQNHRQWQFLASIGSPLATFCRGFCYFEQVHG